MISNDAMADAAEAPHRLSSEAVVRQLSEVIGNASVAAIGGVKNHRSVYQWMSGERQPDRLQALRFALQLVYIFRAAGESDQTIAAWFSGLNPRLGDTTPLLELSRGASDAHGRIMTATRAFLRLG